MKAFSKLFTQCTDLMPYNTAALKSIIFSLFVCWSIVLVDKDNNPRWSPSKLEDVTNEKVDTYFHPLGESDLIL